MSIPGSPSQNFQLDLPTVSGITGSISIACWVVVFSPQIIENFRRSSAEGLSIVFIVVWLLGDVFNILGAVLQGVLPTMVVLAVYYTLADIVLLLQCFYYRGFTLSDAPTKPQVRSGSDPEHEPLLTNASANSTANNTYGVTMPEGESNAGSRRSSSTIREHLAATLQQDGTRMSPAVPMHGARDTDALKARSPVQKGGSILKSVLFNGTAVIVVCAAGVLGWWLSVSATGSGSLKHRHHHHKHHQEYHQENEDTLTFNVLGQVFGYICAVLYLGSRLPQLLLNYRRKSTEGISMLFFLFACLGNLTYVISIFAYETPCASTSGGCKGSEASAQYGKYIAVNLSWLIGSAGTLFLDATVFVQYFMYRNDQGSRNEHAVE